MIGTPAGTPTTRHRRLQHRLSGNLGAALPRHREAWREVIERCQQSVLPGGGTGRP
jgi:hypothetical protein